VEALATLLLATWMLSAGLLRRGSARHPPSTKACGTAALVACARREVVDAAAVSCPLLSLSLPPLLLLLRLLVEVAVVAVAVAVLSLTRSSW
jgi:hypothetical protein